MLFHDGRGRVNFTRWPLGEGVKDQPFLLNDI